MLPRQPPPLPTPPCPRHPGAQCLCGTGEDSVLPSEGRLLTTLWVGGGSPKPASPGLEPLPQVPGPLGPRVLSARCPRWGLHPASRGQAEEGSPQLPPALAQDLTRAPGRWVRLRNADILPLLGREPPTCMLGEQELCVLGGTILEGSFHLVELRAEFQNQVSPIQTKVSAGLALLGGFTLPATTPSFRLVGPSPTFQASSTASPLHSGLLPLSGEDIRHYSGPPADNPG